QRASPLAENLVRDARVCQGWQCRLLLPKRAEVQDKVRDARLQRQGEPRRRPHVADRLRAKGADCRRRGNDPRAREESGALRTESPLDAALSKMVRLDGAFPRRACSLALPCSARSSAWRSSASTIPTSETGAI